MKLGALVRDRISGFEGIATAQTTYLNGCVRVCVQSTTLNDGKPFSVEWFDSQQIEIIKDTPQTKAKKKEVGGPGPVPPRRDPSPL